jgi:hypothetical protein
MFYNNLCKHIGKENKLIIIFDGPPASGKTTCSIITARKLRFLYLKYKALGPINIVSTLIIRIAPDLSKNPSYIKTKEDPLLLLKSQMLKKIRFIIFLTELLYKIFQVITLIMLSTIYKRLVIDEFFTLRAANYINVYLHKGLSKRQAELLIRIDLALLKALAKHHPIYYIYIDRDTEELKHLWHNREHDKEYSEKYLTLVRLVWKTYKNYISGSAQIHQNLVRFKCYS